MTAITVTIWHNVARDQAGRHIALLDGYRPGDPLVRVFTYQATAGGQTPEEIADDAYAAFNGHPPGAEMAESARRYRQRRLRALSFPGNSPCCRRSCCLDVSVCVVRDSARVCPCLPLSVRKMPPSGLILTVRRRSGFRWRCCWAGTGLDPDGDGDHDCGHAVPAGLASQGEG